MPLRSASRILQRRQIARVVPTFKEWKGADPITFVLSVNLHRRHLNLSQLGMVAERVATLRQGGDRKSADFKAQSCALIQADAAKAVGVSRRQVQKARVVRNEATPEDVAAVERGEKSISAVVNKVRAAEDTTQAV